MQRSNSFTALFCVYLLVPQSEPQREDEKFEDRLQQATELLGPSKANLYPAIFKFVRTATETFGDGELYAGELYSIEAVTSGSHIF